MGLTQAFALFLRTFAVKHFLSQLAVQGGQLAGPLQDALLQFLIQALDFGFSLFVPGGFDNVPSAAPLGYRKLMGSYHIQDFGSAARRQRVRA